jgi:hypothetical protein
MELQYWRSARLEDGQLEVPAAGFWDANLLVNGLMSTDLVAIDDQGRFYRGIEATAPGQARLRIPTSAERVWLADFGSLRTPARLVMRPNARLLDETNQMDMVIVSTEAYASQLGELVAYHGQTMRVKLVDIEAVYNEFNDGLLHTRALHSFLRHTQLAWQTPAPSYALLVGKASYANQIVLPREPRYRTQVPADWVYTSPTGATSTDEEFCYLVGEDTLWVNRNQGLFELIPDRFQDILIGRISVATPGQLAAYLEKHREYRELQFAGPWMETQVHAADQGNDGVFEVGNQLVTEYLVPPALPVAQLHVRGSSAYRGGALDFIDLFNSGSSVLNYNGHGSSGIFSSSSLFRSTDIRFLTNRGKYPINFAWSCSVGDFDSPDSSSLAELLLRKERAGSIAVYAAAAKALITYDNPYMMNWFANQYAEEPYTFGQIVHLTETMMQATTGGRNVVQMYNLLGDPALVPALPRHRLLPGEPLLVAAGGQTVQVTLATEPPGLSGQLEVKYHPNPREPINFLGGASRSWTLAFSDGQTISLDLPADETPRRALLRFAMNAAGDRAVGALPVFLNSTWAAVGGHEPERARAGEGLDFRLEAGIQPDSVELRTNFSLAHPIGPNVWSRNLPLQHLGGGIWTGRIDSLLAPWAASYINIQEEWIDGAPAGDTSRWPSFAGRGLLYRFRIWGAEPFVDANGDGLWTPGESFTDLNGNGQWDPAGEPFVDANTNGRYDAGESYTDLNGNGVRDAWIDLPGRFVPVDVDEGLLALDSLITVAAAGPELEARLRWQVATVSAPDAALRRLERWQPESQAWNTLLADTAAAGPGPQDFRETVALAAGPQRLRFEAGPLFAAGERLEGVDQLQLEDEFLLLTPGAGSGGPQELDSGGDWSFELPPGRLQQPLQLRLATRQSNPLSLRMAGGQPGLALARPGAADSLLAPLQLWPAWRQGDAPGAELDPEAIRLRLGPGTGFVFDDGSAGDSLRPALARWVADRGLWVVLPGLTDSLAGGWRLQAPLRLHEDLLWPVVRRDEQGPALELAVTGQWFGEGDVVPLEPVFQIRLQDVDGLDFGEGHGPPRIWLDGVEIDAAQINLGEGTAATTLTWSPGLLAAGGRHELRIEAGDALGNRTVSETTFTVGGRLELEFFANHPNPFAERTTFAWQLSAQPRSLRFEIYTASGRLVRRLDVLAPRIGYDELVWDGRDREGRPVANGVYFCRMQVEGAGEIDRTFKLARLQ